MTDLRTIALGAALAALAGVGAAHADVSYIDFKTPSAIETTATFGAAAGALHDVVFGEAPVHDGVYEAGDQTVGFSTAIGPVAEPMTWLMMIFGAGLIGASLRGRGKTLAA